MNVMLPAWIIVPLHVTLKAQPELLLLQIYNTYTNRRIQPTFVRPAAQLQNKLIYRPSRQRIRTEEHAA